MKRHNVDILGTSETRWPNASSCRHEGITFYYSGIEETDTYHRIILIRDSLTKHLNNVAAVSGRIIVVQLAVYPLNIDIIQIYDPLKIIKKHEINIVLGEFIAKVGRGWVTEVMGSFGFVSRNEGGEMFIQFCKEDELIIKNTFYELPPRKLYT